MKTKFFLSVVAAMALTLGVKGQQWEKISPVLEGDLIKNNRSNQWYNVIVVGSQQANLDSLKQYFYNHHTPRNERAKLVIQELKNAAQSQQEIIDQLKGNAHEIIDQLWITNIIRLEAPRKTLLDLTNSEAISRIELEDENLVAWHKPVNRIPFKSTRNNEVEPGIEAIGTRFLWSLGYTGKGTKVLNFDTGIWPEHPSFRNNWMGKRGPIDFAWFGYDKKRPGDKTSHGTHTNSTCMGLDPSTNDTMGIAYNAYFMATDPIVDNTADIKSFGEMALGYQWSIDPDGDPNTTEDMPDVINNSWGRAHQSRFDTVVCDGFFGDVLDAVELAGIISVQSAGNNGPGAGTIGSPANKNTTLVNNFSVGAVDGNNANFPIASFSSRGPSQCGDTGSLYIKPEVVAPGVNVLGAVRNDDLSYSYDVYSGTSMAGPHAAGLALLLREAFPQASAEEIKMAMYVTADDLGDPGEDNTFGMGMINAEASYTYLAQSYTPETPASNNFDLSIEWCSLDDITATCATEFELKIAIKSPVNFSNWGAVSIDFGFLGETIQTYTFSGAPNSDTVTVGTISSSNPGFKEVVVQMQYTEAQQEWELLNNNWYSRFHLIPHLPLPYSEQFEGVNLYRSEWYVEDVENDQAFDTASSAGLINSEYSARIRLPRYEDRDGSRDGLITPSFQAPNNGTFEMYFDVAYSSAFSGFNDSLLIKVSTDCGNTWVPTAYKKGPDELKTDPNNDGFDWVPQTADQWRRDTVDLSAFLGEESVLIKFESYNKKGGSIYIDNVNVYGSGGPLLVADNKSSNQLQLYPNPAQNTIRLTLREFSHQTRLEVRIIGLAGNVVDQLTTTNYGEMNIDHLKPGVYIIEAQTNGEMYSQKLIVQ